jgi:hypothetical protein
MNDDFDSQKPEEAGSTYEDFAPYPEDLCPSCGSPKIDVIAVRRDDHYLVHENVCTWCGCTWET